MARVCEYYMHADEEGECRERPESVVEVKRRLVEGSAMRVTYRVPVCWVHEGRLRALAASPDLV